jgi:hypothetical protein
MNNIKESISNSSYLYIDELDNVICESTFTVVLGKIDGSYRFIPKSNLVVEQGLTPQMLMVIAELIKRKAGIGEKRVEFIEEETEGEFKK